MVEAAIQVYVWFVVLDNVIIKDLVSFYLNNVESHLILPVKCAIKMVERNYSYTID